MTDHLSIRGLTEHELALKKGIDLNIPTLLIGETGTGKTSLVKKLAKEQGQTVVRVNLNGQTSIDEFVGKYILKGGEMVWQDGALTQCLRNGWWILVDEINAALPEILFVLHSLLDDDRSILLSEKDGELIKAHDNFRFFATMNPVEDYAGTKDLNKALLSRFGVVLRIGYVNFDTEVEVVVERTGIDFNIAKQIVTTAVKTRKLKDEEKLFDCMSTRDVIGVASLAKVGVNLDEAMKTTFINKLSKDEVELLEKHGLAKGISRNEVYYTKTEVEDAKSKGIKEERERTKDVVTRLEKQIELLTKTKRK